MSRPYSHQDPSPERTGEWDSPSSRSHRNSPARSTSSRRHDQGTQLVHRSSQPVVLSTLKQQVLPEDEYLAHLSSIIQRDFFPHLRTLEQRNDVLDAFDSRDPRRIESSVRTLRELAATPTPRRRARDSATPYSTRESARGDLTPTHFDRTPLTSFSGATPSSSTASSSSRRRRAPPPPRVDPHISLDAFQARYTSQDNASFQDLLASDNAQRRTTHAWAFDAEVRANQRAVRGRQARERLVDVTRRMVDASGDGSVRLVEGPAGRPGERRLVVDGGVEVGAGERLLVTGRDAAERLLITDGADAGKGEGRGREQDGEGEEGALVVRVDEAARQFVDYDKATADEDDDARPVDARELQVQSAAWPFKTRNSFMFPPDADRSNPSSLTGPPSARTATAAASSSSASSSRTAPILVGEPKGVRHAATRLEALERGEGASSSRSDRSSFGVGASEASLSPSRSRIGAAIAGTPYPTPPQSATPRVGGFSFVDALPTLPSAALPPHALQELMTWGTIEATPVVLRAAEADSAGGAAGGAAGGGGGGGGGMGGPSAVGPFRVREADRREELAHRMARRAKRSLAESGASPRGGLALGGPGAGGLRREAVEASVRGSTPGGGARGGGGTPSASARADALSPAARSLLGRTKPGRALEAGLGRTEAWREEGEERRRIERAKQRAREVESRERLRRERWSPSPSVHLGFDPDLPDRR
ncbi:hypothetical protein JCM9279_006524 [Rhodotorula babjevae]